jgi:hypothetical protein
VIIQILASISFMLAKVQPVNALKLHCNIFFQFYSISKIFINFIAIFQC